MCKNLKKKQKKEKLVKHKKLLSFVESVDKFLQVEYTSIASFRVHTNEVVYVVHTLYKNKIDRVRLLKLFFL